MWTSVRDFLIRELVIFIDPTHLLHVRRKKQALASVGIALTLGMAAAMGVAPLTLSNEDAPRITEPLTMPATLAEQIEQLGEQPQVFIRQEQMMRGDTIASLLRRLSVQDPDAERFLRRDPVARRLYALRPGQIVQARTDDNDALLSLRVLLDSDAGGEDARNSRQLLIERSKQRRNDFHAQIIESSNDLQYEMRSGSIDKNFFAAMDDADVPDSIVEQMIDIFSGVIDFHHDIRTGDRFRIVYESAWNKGSFVRNGRIVAIELINRGKVHQALWYGANRDMGAYYTFDGRAMRRAFLRSPVAFSRVSSGFGGRSHPIYGDWRQHKGIDFAAPHGTPVHASGDGIVEFSGWQNGYGNVVILRHKDRYSTYYAHLSGFASKLRIGQSIRQGQTLGYVGATGAATGPHLHYEFRHYDQPQDPSKSALVDVQPLSGSQRQQFLAYTGENLRRINALRAFNVAATQY